MSGVSAKRWQPVLFLDDLRDESADSLLQAMTKNARQDKSIPITGTSIKDSPPFHYDGRLLTLDDSVEFYNIVPRLKLSDDEKEALVAFLRCL